MFVQSAKERGAMADGNKASRVMKCPLGGPLWRLSSCKTSGKRSRYMTRFSSGSAKVILHQRNETPMRLFLRHTMLQE